MKHFKLILSLVVAFTTVTVVNAQSTKPAKTVIKDSVLYQCPMKCEGDKTYNLAGKCPKCGMGLKALPAAEKAKLAAFKCPMKCEGDKVYNEPGKCPKCKMDLAKVVAKTDKAGHEGHDHN